MPHQWLEGNLPVSAKCVACERNCGSVRRLQDWRCLWCKAIVSAPCWSHVTLQSVCRSSFMSYITIWVTEVWGTPSAELQL